MKSTQCWTVGIILGCCALMAGCEKGSGDATSSLNGGADASARCPHDIKKEKCPFCNPGLIESDGFCGEHGVAEALCAQCRPYLKTAFRAKGDWCNEHGVPESQCVECNPDLKKNIRTGEHGT
jgi:hypothetical protein